MTPVRVALACGGWKATAEVRASDRGFVVRIGGCDLPVEVREVRPGVGVAQVGGLTLQFFSARQAEVLHLHALGHTYAFSQAGESVAPREAEGGDVRAPMSGVVTRVLVEPGQRVQAGQGLYVLEAMKMETVVHAPRSARVRRVLARAGDQVEGGASVVELEEEP